jgi:hypothetical protein
MDVRHTMGGEGDAVLRTAKLFVRPRRDMSAIDSTSVEIAPKASSGKSLPPDLIRG